MKKFFTSMILVLALIFGESFAHAVPVQIYDSDVENIIGKLQVVCGMFGIDIWGKEYYTYQGARRCELNFGNSRKNIIRFRLNNDNSVSRVLITFPTPYIESNPVEVLFVLSSIFGELGLNYSETNALTDNLQAKLERMSSYATHFHDKSSVWCAKTNRYITLDFELDYSKVDFYLYASK